MTSSRVQAVIRQCARRGVEIRLAHGFAGKQTKITATCGRFRLITSGKSFGLSPVILASAKEILRIAKEATQCPCCHAQINRGVHD